MLKKRLINFFLTLVVLVYIVFEELIWERFTQPIIRYIDSLKILKRLEAYLQSVNSAFILVIFIMMFILVETLGIYAGMLFLDGKIIQGVLLYAAKIPIAAFTFWLFGVTKDKLMEFGWFKKSYEWIMATIQKIKSSEVYTNVTKRASMIKRYLKEQFFQDKGLLKKKIQTIYRKLKALLKM